MNQTNQAHGTVKLGFLDDPEMHRQWDEYVLSKKEGTFFHLSGWKRLFESTFALKTYYIYAHDPSGIRGVMPLTHIKSRLFGSMLVSSPYSVYGGIISDTRDIASLILAKAIQLCDELGADYLEVREQANIYDGLICSTTFSTFRKDISPDNDINFQAIPRKQRAMVRKGIEAGLEQKEEDNIDTFYKIYSTSVRNLGTPNYPLKYFQTLFSLWNDKCRVHTVYHQGTAVTSVMSFVDNNVIYPYYAGGIPEARNLKAFDFMYWTLMSMACHEGIKTFDYGRSMNDTGAYHFKKNWGFEPKPLQYQFYQSNKSRVPGRNPDQLHYRIVREVWKKIPVSIANRIGPFLSGTLW